MRNLPKRFLILGNGEKPSVPAEAEAVRKELEAAGIAVDRFDLSGDVSVEDHRADLALVFGGDGAILRAVHQMGRRQLPVLGINLGRLGFLAEIYPDEFRDVLPGILAGDYQVNRHIMIECEIESRGETKSIHALNDIVISAGPPFRIIDIELTIDGESVASFNGDGLIVATPIGSTAHNLAAGGPILRQTLPAVAITPICPHALTFRPLVESSDRTFVLRCPNASEGTSLIIDGFLQFPMKSIESVTLTRSDVDFLLARLPRRSYYGTLTEKLQWGSHRRRPG